MEWDGLGGTACLPAPTACLPGYPIPLPLAFACPPFALPAASMCSVTCTNLLPAPALPPLPGDLSSSSISLLSWGTSLLSSHHSLLLSHFSLLSLSLSSHISSFRFLGGTGQRQGQTLLSFSLSSLLFLFFLASLPAYLPPSLLPLQTFDLILPPFSIRHAISSLALVKGSGQEGRKVGDSDQFPSIIRQGLCMPGDSGGWVWGMYTLSPGH